MARDLELNSTGFFWFAFGAVQGRNYFPTDGQGGFGETITGDASTDSHLRDFGLVRIVRMVVTSGAVGNFIINAPPGGSPFVGQLIKFGSVPAVGHVVGQNYQIRADGGFTCRSNAAGLEGICIYERLVRRSDS